MGLTMKLDNHRLFLSITEGLMIYGLIIFVYGTIVIHVTQTWSEDWSVDRNLLWLTLDKFIMVSFALSLGFITWRYLIYTEKAK